MVEINFSHNNDFAGLDAIICKWNVLEVDGAETEVRVAAPT